MTLLLATKEATNYCVISEEHEAFTTGDCWRLAKALNELYRYRMAFYGIRTMPTATGRDFTWIHCFVALDEETFLDITGVKSREMMEMSWEYKLAENLDENASGVICVPSPEMATIYIAEQPTVFPSFDAYEVAQQLHENPVIWG